LKRIVVLVVLAATFLVISATTALGQADTSQVGCDWYWATTFYPNGGWEYWCWDPQLGGWWYGESADGNHKIFNPNFSSS
jgi:hypothetical protein